MLRYCVLDKKIKKQFFGFEIIQIELNISNELKQLGDKKKTKKFYFIQIFINFINITEIIYKRQVMYTA